MEMQTYYKRRVNEYEEIYYRDDPIRQKEQRKIVSALKVNLKGRNVLEVACGTGYWTQFLSETAESIMAIDVVGEVLKFAQQKHYKCPISFKIADAYKFPFKANSFNGGLANFWLSHVSRNKIDDFLRKFHRILKKGSKIFFADNVYVRNTGGTLVSKNSDVNTYKQRLLKNGSRVLVLKNYYTIDELLDIFRKYDKQFNKRNIFYGSCFWYLNYQI